MNNRVCLSFRTSWSKIDEIQEWMVSELGITYDLVRGLFTVGTEYEKKASFMRILPNLFHGVIIDLPNLFHGVIIDFVNPEDAALFKLTWGEYCIDYETIKRYVEK